MAVWRRYFHPLRRKLVREVRERIYFLGGSRVVFSFSLLCETIGRRESVHLQLFLSGKEGLGWFVNIQQEMEG